MAKHDVSFNVPQRRLGKTNIDFVIKIDGDLSGKLAISNGSIVWFPKGTKNGLKMGWKKFDEVMQENAMRSERGK
jgi:hypothetical protein